MYKSTFWLLVLFFSSLVVNGFVPSSHPSLTKERSTKLHVSFPIPPEDGKEASPGVVGRPLGDGTKDINKKLVYVLKKTVFDTIFFEDTVERSFARFWALETIARMPYFSYLTALHFYETIGWWRKSDYLKIHFAETWNEQHHLMIMEELGGSTHWFDRFIAEHIALGYFWLALLFYFVNPVYAYNFNQAVEEEAFETYTRFIEKNESFLKEQPAPMAAVDYYGGDDLYMLDSITGDGSTKRRPEMNSLYDCFVAIRDDEAEHAKTMIMMQEEMI